MWGVGVPSSRGYKRLLIDESLGCPCSGTRVSVPAPSTLPLLYKRYCAEESEGCPCALGDLSSDGPGVTLPPYKMSWAEESDGWLVTRPLPSKCKGWVTKPVAWASGPGVVTDGLLGYKMLCNEESDACGVLVFKVSLLWPDVSASSPLFVLSLYIANCIEESEGCDVGRGEPILISPSGVSHVFLPLASSLSFPSSVALSAGLSHVLLPLLSIVLASELNSPACRCESSSFKLSDEISVLPSLGSLMLSALTVESDKSAVFPCCSALNKASVFTPLAISDIKLWLGTDTVVDTLETAKGLSPSSLPDCAVVTSFASTGVWATGLCVIWSLRLSNRACSWARNWALVESSSLRRMSHWARNSLYSISRVSSS